MSFNKVYINPNFSRNPLFNYNLTDKGAMYVNPKFSDAVPSVDHMYTAGTKIYINPSFIRSAHPPVPVSERPMIRNVSLDITSKNDFGNNYNQNLKSDKPTLSTVTNKSRYSLVRLNNTKYANVTVANKITNTVKISKYKLVPLNNIKNVMLNTKCSENPTLKNPNGSPLVQKQSIVRPSVINVSRSSRKFIKYKPAIITGLVTKSCVGNMVSREATKNTNSTLKIKLRKVLKKNNIPCPLFKKFGKCIRQVHGHCDFLHDKKHISICRKFLKGACHNKDCLLSHDLTMKKMPTCYFYLKGMCAKTDCPYLHIKLNEKSKICPDFLKGYCEKGKKCLNRHVNISFDTTPKHVNTSKPTSTYKSNTQFVKKWKRNSKTINYEVNKYIENSDKNHAVELKGSTTEYRYYQDNDDSITGKELSEIIKPSRCKLGALPSFIQL